MRHPLRRMTLQGAWYAAGTALAKVSGLILLPVLTNTRYLSVADYGLWGVLEISAQIAIVVVGLSLSVGLVRFHHEPETGPAAAAAWWMTVGTTSAALALGNLLIPLLAPEGTRAIYRWLLLHVGLEVLFAVVAALYRARERAFLHTTAQAIKLAALVVLALWFMTGRGLGLLGLVRAAAISSAAALGFALAGAGSELFTLRVPRATALRVLRFSAPLVIGGLGSMILNAGDRYVLAALRPPQELAYYSLAGRFGGVVNMLAVQPLNLAWMPLLFRMREDQRPGVLRLLVPYLTLALCAGVLLISLGAGPLLQWMGSDPSYARSVPLVPWIGLGFAAFGLAVVTTGVLALFQRTRVISLGILLTAALNLALNFALVPSLGATGSAVATLVSYLTLIVAHFLLIRPLMPNQYPWGRVAGIAFATAAASFAIALRPYRGEALDWILRGAIPLAWAGLLLAARWFSVSEAREIWRVLRSN